MTLIDLINEVKQSRNKVIPTSYILSRLRELEKDDCPNCVRIPVYEMSALRSGLERVKGGGENRDLSENDRRSS